MTRIFLFVLLLTGQISYGQLTDSISKITFRYDKGHYTFGSSGKYSISEIIEFSKLNNKAFQITNYIQLKNTYYSATDDIKIDTIKLNFSKYLISDSNIEKLLMELNMSRNNFNASFVKLYLKEPTEKEIIAVANKYDLKWKFKNKYSDREDRTNLFKNIKEYFLLDTFLLMKKPELRYDIIRTDIWNILSITCLEGVNTIEYRSEFFDLFGQPVKRYDNKKYSTGKKYINLLINTSIKELVPPNSLISKAVDLNQLKEEYIKWFISTNM